MLHQDSPLVFCAILGLLLAAGFCQGQEMAERASLDDLISQIFTTPSTVNKDLVDSIFTTPKPSPVTPPRPDVFQPTPTKTTVLTPDKPNDNGGNSGNSGTIVGGEYKSCGDQKECVPRHLCNNGKISTTGENFIDIRINGVCGYLEECCDLPNKQNKSVLVLEEPDDHNGCGFLNREGVGYRITGGNDSEAEFGEFPWMVAILREEQTPTQTLNLYECGGALIAPDIVVTAAHCVSKYPATSFFARAGEWDTQTRSEVIPHQDQRVKDVIIHEQFHKGALFNDIAIVFLEAPFVLDQNVRPICLPPADTNFNHLRCYATGWGKDQFGSEGKYQVILKKIDLPVLPHDTCQNNLRKTRLGKYFELDQSFICAGGEAGKDTCKGDGGSPLVCPIVGGAKDRFYHAGIVAWGVGCGEVDVPGIYANVARLRPWLDEKLKFRNVNFKSFTP